MGLCCVGINVATLLYYAPDLEPCPNWVYFTFAIGLWVYQSFDAIDGKQARRTGTSGPLGELFDHGCDAINTTLEVLLSASTLSLGQSWWTVSCLFASLANFYLSTWEEYHTGTLYLSYFSGPVEGILMIIGLHVLSGIYGPGIWLRTFGEIIGPSIQKVPYLSTLLLNEGFLVIGGVGLGMNILNAWLNVMHAHRKTKTSSLPALLGLLPFAFSSTLAYLWLNASPDILTQHLVPFIFFLGCTFAYTVGLMITAHVTKAPFPYFNVTQVPLLLGCLNANLPKITGGKVESFFGGASERPYLWGCFAFALIMYAHFAMSVITDICSYFDINCLTIKAKGKKEE